MIPPLNNSIPASLSLVPPIADTWIQFQFTLQYNTIPHNSIPCNTTQYNTMPYNTIQNHSSQFVPLFRQQLTLEFSWDSLYKTIRYHTIPYNTIKYHTIPYNTIQYHTIPYKTIQYHTIPYFTISYHTHRLGALFQSSLFQGLSKNKAFVWSTVYNKLETSKMRQNYDFGRQWQNCG